MMAMATAATLMVQEDRETEGDEFRQEPEPEEVEDVCEEPLGQNTIRCGGAMPGRVTPVQERRAFSPGCLRDDLLSDPYYFFTLVQETEVISIWHRFHRIVAGRDDRPDCLPAASLSILSGAENQSTSTNIINRVVSGSIGQYKSLQ